MKVELSKEEIILILSLSKIVINNAESNSDYHKRSVKLNKKFEKLI